MFLQKNNKGTWQVCESVNGKIKYITTLKKLGLTPEQFKEMIQQGKELSEMLKGNPLIISALGTAVKRAYSADRERHLKKIELPPIPIGDVYYADPPWRYDFSETITREIENQYPTMELEDIKKILIPQENAAIFLWGTAPKLIEALEVMKAWGFVYKTNAVWDKKKIGMGYWFRGQHELLLIGTKGVFSPPAQNNRISSVLNYERTNHSEKPIEVHQLIENILPGLRYVELFSRKPPYNEKWQVWGNEI